MIEFFGLHRNHRWFFPAELDRVANQVLEDLRDLRAIRPDSWKLPVSDERAAFLNRRTRVCRTSSITALQSTLALATPFRPTREKASRSCTERPRALRGVPLERVGGDSGARGGSDRHRPVGGCRRRPPRLPTPSRPRWPARAGGCPLRRAVRMTTASGTRSADAAASRDPVGVGCSTVTGPCGAIPDGRAGASAR